MMTPSVNALISDEIEKAQQEIINTLLYPLTKALFYYDPNTTKIDQQGIRFLNHKKEITLTFLEAGTIFQNLKKVSRVYDLPHFHSIKMTTLFAYFDSLKNYREKIQKALDYNNAIQERCKATVFSKLLSENRIILSSKKFVQIHQKLIEKFNQTAQNLQKNPEELFDECYKVISKNQEDLFTCIEQCAKSEKESKIADQQHINALHKKLQEPLTLKAVLKKYASTTQLGQKSS
jgi:hypothetical protein